MKVSELFTLYQGNGFELINMDIEHLSEINFVSRTSEDNGVVARVKAIYNKKPFPAGALTVALGGSVLSSFVQNKKFYTGFHVMVLEPKTKMRLEEKLFYCHCIKMNDYRYQYGRQANKTLKDIELPQLPKWLKSYQIDYSRIETKIKKKEAPLNTTKWKKFKISDLFNVIGTKTTKIADLINYGKGIYPYATTQSSNNGVNGFYNYYTETGNVLIVDSAVVGYCSYQEENFSASDHVEKLMPNFNLNKYIGLFIATIINLDNYRYNYGRKFNQIKIRNAQIKLPIDKDGNPDWQFMENYIESLPYSDKI
ncbi:MAG: restriction endonuclease subunit S [Elusimicrobiota bacterium]|jgi:hypothetical protein|nr:restriction endonuclease subunit S [Elusimicrobiota bacterium]